MSMIFDVIVIGGGPGGYVAAIRASQLGLKTACIDDWKNSNAAPALGGTCTNVGCIPSKALLQSSEYFDNVSTSFQSHGIEVEGLKLNLDKMLSRKRNVVKQNNDGIVYLFKKNKVSFFHGKGSFTEKQDQTFHISVLGKEKLTLNAKNVIIATGSKPRHLPNIQFDEKLILSNSGALNMNSVPKKLGVIGAGVIGLEMGSVWKRLGSDVVILEALPEFLSAVDYQIAKEAFRFFSDQGLMINMGVKIEEIKAKKDVKVSFFDKDGSKHNLSFDRLIVSVGRVPNTEGLEIEKINLELDDNGFIKVDDKCRTNIQNVWAIGDVVRGPMLAHKAEDEGVCVAEQIVGQHSHVDLNIIPWVIYTFPEIAWVGKNEQQLKSDGINFKSGTFPFMANGRARAIGETKGMVKVLADAKTDEILGIHIVGPMASELIAEAVVAMEFKASSEDIARICHAHPSLSEATKEAALAVNEKALNF